MQTVIFKCLRSGNNLPVSNINDITDMRKHEGYIEVKDAETSETVVVKPQETSSKKMLKLKPKADVPAFLQE